jgi:glucose-6-phosphate 1-epimerase
MISAKCGRRQPDVNSTRLRIRLFALSQTDYPHMTQTLAQLSEQFTIPASEKSPARTPAKVSFKAGQGGLPCIHINTAHAIATIYLHGAHVTSFQPKGASSVLFMSEKSWYEANKPIRGGVPVCFPWFGPKADDAKAPAHGFARLKQWTLASVDEQADGSIVLLLTLRDDESTRALWPYSFELGHRITVGSSLTMSLEMRNTGLTDFQFEEALHTYFTVGDIHRVKVLGLENSSYVDKVAGGTHNQGRNAVEFTGETDRVYDSQADTVIDDPSMGRRILVSKRQSQSTVVWNPWINKSKAMPDFGDEEWPGMVCVETANVKERAVYLMPGDRHAMSVTISLQPR